MNNSDTSNLCIGCDIASGTCNHFFLGKFLLLLLPSHKGKELAESTAEERRAPTGKGEPDVKVPVLQCENLLYFSPSHSSQRADVSHYTGLLSEALGRAVCLS